MSTVIVGVQYKPKGKIYYFDPKDITFQKGEGVIAHLRPKNIYQLPCNMHARD